MKAKILKIGYFSIFFLLSSCMVGPDPCRPTTLTPKKFNEENTSNSQKKIELTSWWNRFEDRELDNIIQLAISNNFDINIAIEKIDEAKAIYGIKRADLLPHVNMDGRAERRSLSENIYQAPYLGPGKYNFFELGFNAGWEIDLFGKIRRAKQAALFNVQSSIYAQNNIYISIIAETVKLYVSTISYKNQIDVTNKIIKLNEELLVLVTDKFESGISSEIDINNFISILNTKKADLELLITLYKQSYYGLCNILGKSYEDIDEEIFISKVLPRADDKIPEVMPSELIQRRFDIMEAEQQLHASTAEIGNAVADYFPRFSLTGQFYNQSNKTSNLLNSSSNMWTIGPRIFWPLIDFGKIKSNVKAKTSLQKQALLHYEKTVVNAFKEVESTLVGYFKEQNRYSDLQINQLSFERSYDLELSIYSSGISSLFSVYEKKQKALEAKISTIQSHEKVLLNLVNLYKAFGGDW